MTPLTKAKIAYNKYEEQAKNKTLARQEFVNAVVECKKEGYTYERIGEVLGMGKTGVSNIIGRGK